MSGMSKPNQRQNSKRLKRYGAYKAEDRRRKNKARRMLRTLKEHPDDAQLAEKINEYMKDSDMARYLRTVADQNGWKLAA